jgi:type IV pilus assembly protein PilW
MNITSHSKLSSALGASMNQRRSSGFTMVELMISLTLGLLVLGAISTILVSTGKSNREQTALARMQENGRFALSRISADLRMAGAQYCSSFSRELGTPTEGHKLRPLRVLTEATLPWGVPSRPSYVPVPPAGEAGLLSPRFFIQGHECTASAACAPALNVLGAALPAPPGTGTGNGQRAAGADVLTVRYLSGNGVRLAAAHDAGAGPLIIESSASAAPLNFVGGDLAMVTDCIYAEVFSANAGGTSITPSGNSAGDNTLREYRLALDPRVFNFTRDLWTVTYFLRIRSNVDGGANISTLVRQQNGTAMPISDGVERMEFLYNVRAVAPATGAVSNHFLTAAQVQAGTSASGTPLPCLPQPKGVGALEVGCLWRQVESIDVSLLLNTVTDVATRQDERFSYSTATPPIVEGAPPALLPSGLARGRMYRKEFRTRVNVRSFTY